MTDPDSIQLAFNPASLLALNVILGLVMFGVALDLRLKDFGAVLRSPRAPLAGLVAQFALLPAATFGLTQLLNMSPSVALGMLLVASCPGGNVSNFLTHLARGHTETSVSMTAISTAASLVMTPLNLSFWGSLDPGTAAILTQVSLDPADMVLTVALLLGIPCAAGMTLAWRWPQVAARMRRPFKLGSIAFFAVFIVAAFGANLNQFVELIGIVFVPVAIMHGTAVALGWLAGSAARVSAAERRAVVIEVSIQNSGLGLILIFNFFGGLGGMAAVAAWWGIWHIVAGMSLAMVWSRLEPARPTPQPI